MKLRIHHILIAVLIHSFGSCTEDNITPDPTLGLTKIGEGISTEAGAKVVVWANSELIVGYNRVFVELFDSNTGKRITKSHVAFHPLMTMSGGMSHSCPVENPEEDAIDSLFPGAISFVMPSGDMGSWTLDLHIHNHANNKEGEVELAIDVMQPDPPQMKSFTTEASEKYFVSYHFPSAPKVGINEIHVVVNSKEDMMNWPAVTDLTLMMEPEMVSMGHGSPNNVNPSATASGHYVGKVNFTMTGDWRINLTLKKNDETLEDLYFDLLVD